MWHRTLLHSYFPRGVPIPPGHVRPPGHSSELREPLVFPGPAALFLNNFQVIRGKPVAYINVRLWHLADISQVRRYVRSWE